MKTISNSVFPDVKLEEAPGGGETGCKTTASLRSLDVTCSGREAGRGLSREGLQADLHCS